MSTFQKYAQYYNLLYADKDYKQEACYVGNLIKQYNPTASSLLEFGCGTGKHAKLFAQNGFRVHGVDLSAEMIALAQQQNNDKKLSFECADIRAVELNEKFDLVVSLFHVMSYQVSNDDLDKVFITAANHLYSGGLFIFDCWFGPAVLTDRPCVRIKRVENENIKIVRIAEPLLHSDRNCVDVNFTVYLETKSTKTIESFTEQHVMRYLFTPEIEALCQRHGFILELNEEWLTKRSLDCLTWGACFVCKKR